MVMEEVVRVHGWRILEVKMKRVAMMPEKRASQLKQWPIQLHLISPMAPYYQKADVLLSADCVAYAAGDFHKDYLKGKSIAIGCPKLDEGQEVYSEKVAVP